MKSFVFSPHFTPLHSISLLPLLFLFGCSSHDHSDKMIFRYNETVGIATLDPAFAKDQSTIWPCKQIYNGLVELSTSEEGDGAMQVEPSIAKSWTISPDGLTYTFTLRDDVYFHKNELFNKNNQLSSHSLSLPLTPSHSPKYDSTRRVVASDFIYSFRRITDPAVLSPGTWVFNEVDTFYATNDTTLVIRLREPFSPFLSLLGMVYCSVVPHEVVEHYGKDFRSHPCGTGPFQLQYWKEGVKLVLRKNPYYFEFDTLEPARPQGAALNSDEINQISEKSGNQTIKRLPYLDAVAITFIVDRQTVFLEFVKEDKATVWLWPAGVPSQSLIATNSTSLVNKNLLLHRIIMTTLVDTLIRRKSNNHTITLYDVPLSVAVSKRHSFEVELPHSC